MNFYRSLPQACPYLPGREETLVLSDPAEAIGAERYSFLLQEGFRRNGAVAYRPDCRHCQACLSVRVPVGDFRPNRSQKRNLRRNADLRLELRPAQWEAEAEALFLRYLRHRHPGGGMDNQGERLYREMMEERGGVETVLLQSFLGDRLVAVALTDVLAAGCSAVYTFYEPDLPRRGLGTWSILAQLHWTARLGLPYLYLGYWIADSKKMAYKRQFQPLEAYTQGTWQVLPANDLS